MLYFEKGFPGIDSAEDWPEIMDMPKYEKFEDSYLVGAPFAAHCPSLRLFATVHRSAFNMCQVHRTTAGYTLTEVPFGEQAAITQEWNVDIHGGWGALPPIEV